jgi:AraC-like DNA-binding protein
MLAEQDDRELAPTLAQVASKRLHAPRTQPNIRDLAVGSEDVDIDMVSLVIAKAVVGAARELGVVLQPPELEAVEHAGIDDPAFAMPRRTFIALLQTVAKELQDPAAGARLASMMRADHFHFMGPFVMSSTSARQAFERFLVVRRRVIGGPAWRAVSDGQEVRLVHSVDLRLPGAQLEAQFTATLAERLASEFLGPRARTVVGVEFAFPAPDYHERIRAFFNGEVRFGSEANGAVFPLSVLTLKRSGSDAAFADAMERFARQRFLVNSTPSTWSNRVRQMLLVAQAPAEVELESLAAGWRISARSARRRLEIEHTTFKAIREQVCMEMAGNLLSQHGQSSLQVAERLGYREVNSFRRAFKRWFGSTPSAYRNRGTNELSSVRGESANRPGS